MIIAPSHTQSQSFVTNYAGLAILGLFPWVLSTLLIYMTVRHYLFPLASIFPISGSLGVWREVFGAFDSFHDLISW